MCAGSAAQAAAVVRHRFRWATCFGLGFFSGGDRGKITVARRCDV
jgi:hypothetical protein